MNIDQIAMYYLSMDSSQRTLQTIKKLFPNFQLLFKFRPKTEKFG